MATFKKTKAMPALVGYSLAGFAATAIVFIFFWLLFNLYYATIIVDSDTYLLFDSFFRILSLIFLSILGFTFFPVLLYFIFRPISSLAKLQKKGKKSILKTVLKQENAVLYYGTIAYWVIYIIGFVTSFLKYSSTY